MKLQKSRKLQKLRRAILPNFTQFHPILPNFVQFFKHFENVSSINFARKFPCKKNGLKISPPRNFNQFQPISANFHQFVPILSNFPQFYSIFFVNFREKSKLTHRNCCKLRKIAKIAEITRNCPKLPEIASKKLKQIAKVAKVAKVAKIAKIEKIA